MTFFLSHGPGVLAMRDLQPTVSLQWSPDDLTSFERAVNAQMTSFSSENPSAYSPLVLLNEYMSSRPNFGYSPFLVHNPELAVLPPALFVGVGMNGIFLVDAGPSKAVLKQFKFAHVTGWAANAIKFSIRILIARGKTQQLNFATSEGNQCTGCRC